MKQFLSLSAACFAISLLVSTALAQSYGVFELAREGLSEGVSAVADQVVTQATDAGMTVLSRRAAGVPGTCEYEAEVISLFQPDYVASLFGVRADTAPYASVDRVVVFSDEGGTHVAFVNPPGIARTVMLNDQQGTSLAAAHRAKMRSLLGTSAGKVYGPVRERGLIGKTMGVMAGGPFDEKIQTHGTVADGNWRTLADAMEAAMQTPGSRWGLTSVYRVDLEAQQLAILGVSGSAMEAKSFDIVGAGSNRDRKNLECPGLAHAAAYPLEMVVRQNGSAVDIEFVDAMYRMKMYFEDAGKWAFMKNMTMPGSIADELKGFIREATTGR